MKGIYVDLKLCLFVSWLVLVFWDTLSSYSPGWTQTLHSHLCLLSAGNTWVCYKVHSFTKGSQLLPLPITVPSLLSLLGAGFALHHILLSRFRRFTGMGWVSWGKGSLCVASIFTTFSLSIQNALQLLWVDKYQHLNTGRTPRLSRKWLRLDRARNT